MRYEVAVISGNDLDISFRILAGPHNHSSVVSNHDRIKRLLHNFETKNHGGKGDFSFCFDNSYSVMESKHVSFFLTSNDEYRDPYFASNEAKNVPRDELGEELNAKVDSFKDRFDKLKRIFEQIQHTQMIYNEYERMDRETAEMNFTRVNIWSGVSIFMMVTAGYFQVMFIRSLFEDKSRIGRVLRGEQKSRI
jgi:hypothetical protein